MRKIKSTALLGAFVAVASVGAISHEAHGTTVTSVVNTIAKEALPNYAYLPAPLVTPSVDYPSNATVTLTLSGASFLNGPNYPLYPYEILGNGGYVACSAYPSYPGQNTLTFNNCSLTANTSYSIVDANNLPFFVYGSQGTSSIVLSYSSNVGGDTPSSVTLVQVQQQLTVTPASAATATINPGSLSIFVSGSNANSNTAYNTMTISSSTGFYASIFSDTLNVVFNGIPSSVSTISTVFTYGSDTSSSNYTQGTGSATVSLSLNGPSDAVFSSPYSDTATFNFVNSGNIQPGTIYISSIQGVAGSYSYFSGSQNFLTFTIGGTQLYIPDTLAPDNNAINTGYITISMPSSASIASISVLNNPNASCPTNGILTSTSTPNVYYINLATLAASCTGITPTAWQSGVPLVINITGANATPNNITADAYATFNNMLKRIPVDVLNISSSFANFSY